MILRRLLDAVGFQRGWWRWFVPRVYYLWGNTYCLNHHRQRFYHIGRGFWKCRRCDSIRLFSLTALPQPPTSLETWRLNS